MDQSSQLERFLASSPEAIVRWKSLRTELYPELLSVPFPDKLIPLSGTPHFERLSPERRRNLFIGFTKLNAEALILLEQTFLVAFRRFHRFGKEGEAGPRAARKLAVEEYYHTRAFRNFLRTEPHVLDEALHVGFQFAIYEHAFPRGSWRGSLRTALGTLGFILARRASWTAWIDTA